MDEKFWLNLYQFTNYEIANQEYIKQGKIAKKLRLTSIKKRTSYHTRFSFYPIRFFSFLKPTQFLRQANQHQQ